MNINQPISAYKTAIILFRNLLKSGTITESEFRKCESNIAEKYGLSLCSIPQTINPLTHLPNDAIVKRKVAGYAWVSTEQEEQQTSYAAQMDYYTKYIKMHAEWKFVKVYTDEGISATNTKHRDGFNQMIANALAGKINLIITRSVSRFARNTMDSLSTIRKLKEHNVECYFEKEQIWTFDGNSEIYCTRLIQ